MNDLKIIDEALYKQYAIHLNFDWKDKVILDIGSEIGTSIEFFLLRGAKFVWGVEGDPILAGRGQGNIDKYFKGMAQSIQQWIDSPYAFERVLSFYGASGPIRADIIKIDIEGWECCLLGVNDRIIAEQKEFIIDTHSKLLTVLIAEKLVKNGFIIVDDVVGDVLHAIRKPS